MSTYLRPDVDLTPMVREDGGSYGQLWQDGPPEDAYSHTSHVERFAPLHTVADALVAHLVDTYEVAVDSSRSALVVFEGRPFEVTRVARLVPARPDAAPLTVAWTSFPGIRLQAGAAAEYAFPVCGCDACDDDVAHLARELEDTVLTIAAGGLSESVESDRGTWITRALSTEHLAQENARQSAGASSSRSLVSREAADDALGRLRAAPHGWMPWPSRA